MARETTERVALRPKTKSLLEDKTPDGVDFDFYIRHAIKHAPPVGEQ